MFNKLTLGKKIAFGFGFLIFIVVLLGSISAINMYSVVSSAESLSDQYMPEIEIANNIQRHANLALSDVDEFMKTGDETYLISAIDNLDKVTGELGNMTALIEKHPDLAAMKSRVDAITTSIASFRARIGRVQTEEEEAAAGAEQQAEEGEEEIDTLVKQNTLLANAMKASDGIARRFLAMCKRFRDQQIQRGNSASANQIITLVDEISDLGVENRVAAWRLRANGDVAEITTINQNFVKIDTKLSELNPLVEAQGQNTTFINSALEGFKGAVNTLKTSWEKMEAIATEQENAGKSILTMTEEMMTGGISDTNTIAKDTVSTINGGMMISIIGLIAALAVGSILAVVITRGITAPVRRIIAGLKSGATMVNEASFEVEASSHTLAEGASHQASSLEEISSTLEQMSAMTKQNADNAKEANVLAKSAKDSAETGNSAMERMAGAINKIKDSADETAKIVKTIDEIAFQTNLLALNAAVEAARAGEAGKGFAVVAEEVRNLAQRSADAAKTTSVLIEESQTNSINGVKVSNEVAEILREIVGSSNKVTNLVNEVAVASEEQANGIEQVNHAVSQMDQLTQSSAATAEETSSASKTLSAQAGELQNIVQEMVAIVGDTAENAGGRMAGPRGTLGSPRSRTALPATRRPQPKAPMQNRPRPKPAPRRDVVVKPEQVIPLDTDDMSDF